jgi:hypothetical protein
VKKTDLTPSLALWSTAYDFYQAAFLVVKNTPRRLRYQMVDYYLICHCVESALKGFLRGTGYTIPKLVNIGHDLEKALKHARAEGIEAYHQFPTAFLSDLAKANFYYKNKDFEYLLAGVVHLPKTPDVLLDGAGRLVAGLEKFCIDTVHEHNDKESAHNPAFDARERNNLRRHKR